MNIEFKKKVILKLLSEESELVNLPNLLKKLGEGFPERSVRRLIAELVADGLVEKTGNKKGTKYQLKIGYIEKCFGSESEKILEKIRRPLFERKPVAYQESWLNSYTPNISFYIPSTLRLELYKSGKRSKQDDPAGTYAHQIFHRLLIDLSYNSSRLEGNTYSLLDTQKLLIEGVGADNKLDNEKVMILNHKEAIRYLVDNAAKLDVSKKTICTLHFLLSDGLVEQQYSGKIRDHGVRIGGSTYIPYDNPNHLNAIFEMIVKKGSQIEDPYEQSFFLLIHFSYLQGFTDVNKRTARLSANIPLIKKNLVPLSFNDVVKDDYTSSIIAIYELQEIKPLLDLYLFSYLRTCSMYDATVQSIGFDEIRVRYRRIRRALLSYIITNQLVGEPMKRYIEAQSIDLVKAEDRKDFIQDAFEDLEHMDSIRIVGLGVSVDQLNAWFSKLRKAS